MPVVLISFLIVVLGTISIPTTTAFANPFTNKISANHASLFPKISPPPPPNFENLRTFLTEGDAVAIWSPNQKIVFSHNLTRQMIPASTLKVLTCLFAFETLGANSQFKTEFYTNENGTLKIKGYGDPFLTTEELITIIQAIKPLMPSYTALVIDDTYFDRISDADGRSNSFKAYDVPTGAFCVNFNTVTFRQQSTKTIKNGKKTYTEYTYVSDDKIPLPIFDSVLPRIKASKLSQGRIMVSGSRDGNLNYAGQVFQYLSQQEGIDATGTIEAGTILPTDKLIYTHISSKTVADAVQQTLHVSSNYIANQLFLLSGAKLKGAPASYPQSAKAMLEKASSLGLSGIALLEGSGLSRQNMISPIEMKYILDAFVPYRTYLRQRDGLWYKTGTLTGVSCLVGFIDSTDGWYTFTIFRRSANQKAFTIADEMRKEIAISVLPVSISAILTSDREQDE